MKKFLAVFISAFLFLTIFAADNTKTIDPGNPAIRFTGRADNSVGGQVSFDWPGVYFQCRFTGKSLGLKLYGEKQIHYNVFIDGVLTIVNSASDGEIIQVAQNLKPGIHTLQVFKRTEALMGISIFKGIVIDNNAEVLPWIEIPERKIEFIGNSITCGYGTEGKDKNERFKPETENNYTSYAAYVSRAFNADYHIVAHSGMGVVRNYGDSLKVSLAPQMPARFNQTLDNNFSTKWDFSRWKPDMVVINLGTNDFSTQPFPDKVVFQRTYEGLIGQIRKVYGNIHVFCLVGPMTNEPCYSYVKEMVENLRILNGDEYIHFIGIPVELTNGEGDLGSTGILPRRDKKKMAAMVAPVISSVMSWDFKME
ncbi:MAG: SGNH/GDSL hydrolase family protein [Bacteroidales bacterium]|nr:SGNH/GDSL hydrolase family protein [Bacteroidales bacterium]